MTTDEADRIIGGIIRRWVTEEGRYFCWNLDAATLTLDGRVDLTSEEVEALATIGDGRGWWNARGMP